MGVNALDGKGFEGAKVDKFTHPWFLHIGNW